MDHIISIFGGKKEFSQMEPCSVLPPICPTDLTPVDRRIARIPVEITELYRVGAQPTWWGFECFDLGESCEGTRGQNS